MRFWAYRLQLIHRRLEDEIMAERRRKLPDTTRVARLKKLKLAVKDRLYNLTMKPRRA